MLLQNFNVSMVTHLTPEKEKVDHTSDIIKLEEDDEEEMRWIDKELNAYEESHFTPTPPFLPPLTDEDPKYCLVVDLDETLIHYNEKENYYLVRPGVN